jgi:hypothetical protein
MKKIYVVFGSTGEWSDKTDWLVKAFKDEEKARDLVTACAETARCIFVQGEKDSDELDDYGVPHPIRFTNKFEDIIIKSGIYSLDPDFKMDYVGTSYYYREVELEE